MTDAKVTSDAIPTDAPKGTKFMVSVKLKSGIKWSDGTALTAKDFVGGYDLMWTYFEPTWNHLLDVRAKDDTTIEFFLKDLSTSTLRSLLRANQTGASSQFKDLYARAAAARAQGLPQSGPVVSKIVSDIDEIAKSYKEQISYGPYKLDQVSPTQLTLVKNPGGFAADVVPGDKFIVSYGTSTQSLPLLLSDQLDFTRDPYSASDLSALAAQRPNVTIVSTPTGTGPALWFNQSEPLFKTAEFRQAVAYIVDRARVAKVALGDQARPATAMAGFSDTLNAQWLDPATTTALNPYAPSADKATALLTGLGLKKQGNSWVQANGDAVKFTISVPTDLPDFLASARDISSQLNTFGFDTTVKGITSAARGDVIKKAGYDTLIDYGFQADAGQPAVPSSSYSYYMLNGYFGSNNPGATDGAVGMNWPTTQPNPSGSGTVKIDDLVTAAQAGLDVNEQKKPVATLAQIYNKQLPVITIYERFTTDPIANGPRITGWLPTTDSLYKNYSTSDNYVAIQLLAGQLKKSDSGDGTIRTSTTYAQPPNAGLGFYSLNSLQQSLNSPTFHMTFPPLFWYSQAGNIYSSTGAIGESYSIAQAS